ncbi:hypothetical protein SeMB42_g02173 [Synchytrium endobioticum]|nr:hypothetical protein SeMB42_g02173 [Synchytrium endobioticum]
MITSLFGDLDAGSFIGEDIILGNKNLTAMFDEFRKNLPTPPNPADDDFFKIGKKLLDEGLVAKHPVLFIPGLISSSLEVWNTPAQPVSIERCKNQNYFRKRMWGTMNQVSAILLDRECWIEHFKLDQKTGLDPPTGFKLRASVGLEAVDYLFPGFWLLAKMISNLAALGYDNNSMFVMSYDWRLSLRNMQLRDLLFTRIKKTIEIAVASNNGEKVVIVAHSLGNLVFLTFLNWVSSPAGGMASSTWAEEHLHSYVDISGPLLGAPKAVSALLSGETRDTAQFSAFATSVLERAFSRRERQALFQSWGVLPAMLPKGGTELWGKLNQHAMDEDVNKAASYSAILTVRGTRNLDLDVDEAIKYLFSEVGDHYWTQDHRFEAAKTQEEADAARLDPAAWSNPLLTPLPRFKTPFSVYCIYGVGKGTERKYYYATEAGQFKCTPTTDHPTCLDEKAMDAQGITHGLNVTHNAIGIENGVELSDGDGTVNLLSLGYMCAGSKGWRSPKSVVNPSRVHIVTREYLNTPVSSQFGQRRGGPQSSDHTDILGNHEMMEDVLRIAAGLELTDKWSPVGGARPWVDPQWET